MDAELSRPAELSGALNRALPARRKIRHQGRFSETKTTRREWRGFQHVADPCGQWLGTETVSIPAEFIPQDHLYSAYAQPRLTANPPVITKQMFGRKLKMLKPDLQEAQRVVDGKKQWVYLGISLRNGGSPMA